MAHLALFLLGPFQVKLDGEPVIAFESDKVRALLAYLAIEADRPHRREKLAGLLWPERPEQDARRNLRYALSNLRAVIGDRAANGDQCAASPSFLLVSRRTIQFNSASDAWVDVAAFANLLASSSPDASDLEQAVSLYRGEFLEGFFCTDSVAFEEWMLLKQEQLGRQARSALYQLAAIYEQRGEYERALPHVWRQVELDPWQEEARRQLMRLLALSGQRVGALARYDFYRKTMAEELGVEPARATTELYERIRAGEFDSVQAERQPVVSKVVSAALPGIDAPAPEPRPLARQHPAKWRRRWVLVWGLVVLVAAAFFLAGWDGLFKKASSELPVLPSPAGTAGSPAGGLVVDVCDRWRPRPTGDETPPQICVGDAWGYHVLTVTDNLEFNGIGRLGWSPDGQQIVFEAEPSQGEALICIIDVDGSNLRRLTEGEDHDSGPAWSPDGQWIAFVRWADLWLVRPDGTDAHELLATGKLPAREVVWSPDSQRIVFLRAASEAGFPRDEVWVVNRDGSDPRLLYSPERPTGAEVRLAWSPDGQQVGCFFLSKSEGSGLLIDADGGGEPQVVEEVPVRWFPDRWPLWGEAE
jgi:DNA-binding SARP family transcriptional activator